jgi:hypothetical protein
MNPTLIVPPGVVLDFLGVVHQACCSDDDARARTLERAMDHLYRDLLDRAGATGLG